MPHWEQQLNGLLELHTATDSTLRRAAWRAGLASLAQACAHDIPGPLDGLAPEPLRRSVDAALQAGLLDDVDWLARPSAGMALYELSIVLPAGEARRALEQRVNQWLHGGDAATFVALATRMALGSEQSLSSEPLRARVALCCALPPALGVRADRLALALLSRRESAREWVTVPAAGSLPDRRMAARLIEQAARAIARQVAQGDDWPLRLLRSEGLTSVLPRLLADREPLVWRHVAVARGLLARFHPPFQQALAAGFEPDLGPTEWRRAATSLTASAASQPDRAFSRLKQVLSRGFLDTEPGAAAALLWGIPVAAEVEPAVAEAMLDAIVEAAPWQAAEAMVEVRALGPGSAFGRSALESIESTLRLWLEPPPIPADDGEAALAASVLEALDGPRDGSVEDAVGAALAAFAERGASAGHQLARDALDMADASVATLELIGEAGDHEADSSELRRRAFSVLRDVSRGVLHDGTIDDLLMLGAPDPPLALLSELNRVRDRIAAWVLAREASLDSEGGGEVAHVTLRIHQLRTLLYSADSRTLTDAPAALLSARQRRQRVATLMLRKLIDAPPLALRRALCATLARAIDALVRTGDLDPSDALLVLIQAERGADELGIIVEASTNPVVTQLLQAYCAAMRPGSPETSGAEGPSSIPPTRRLPGVATGFSFPPLLPFGRVGQSIQALIDFARLIDADASARSAALRGSLLLFGRSLGHMLAAGSLLDLVRAQDGAESTLASFESAAAGLVEMRLHAEMRMGLRDQAALPALTSVAEVIAAAGPRDTGEVLAAIARAQAELEAALPPLLSALASPVLGSLAALPLAVLRSPSEVPSREQPLPAWIPPHRTLGGYFVLSPVAAGGAGSVFIVRRVEDRHDPKAERFALKVPEYAGSGARTLSEAQFHALFRDEASALLSLPHHPNLARFVTFDLAARPKPILVMELIEGMSLEQLLSASQLDSARVSDLLDGVLAGLEAMHSAGVGHLDLKPGNVILRGGSEPVLVDFGLSGRRIRPGCGTLAYGAPEIWIEHGGPAPSPLPCDIYALSSLAFELFTGRSLFDTSSEIVAISAHLRHDGWPARLASLREEPGLGPLSELLSGGMRRDPRERHTAAEMRAGLRQIGARLAAVPWPFGRKVA